MILDFEFLFVFILKFLRKIFNFFLFYNKKNFFIGKLGFVNLFLKINKKFYLIQKIFFELNKKKINKIFIIKYFLLKSFHIVNFCEFNIYNSLYNKKFYKINLLILILKKIKKFFLKLGFEFLDSSDIESTLYNFSFLNISSKHPSFSLSDTFYISNLFFNKIILRTHTTSIHTKYSIFKKLPIKIISIGKVYRSDYDKTHLPVFTQLEFLWVDKDLNFLKLKSIFLKFLKWLFFKDLILKFRSSFFPFTQVSFEVDVFLKKKTWLELSGMGVLHSSVLYNMNINSEIYTGLAFGLGIERILMLYYKIFNLKKIYSGIFEK